MIKGLMATRRDWDKVLINTFPYPQRLSSSSTRWQLLQQSGEKNVIGFVEKEIKVEGASSFDNLHFQVTPAAGSSFIALSYQETRRRRKPVSLRFAHRQPEIVVGGSNERGQGYAEGNARESDSDNTRSKHI